MPHDKAIMIMDDTGEKVEVQAKDLTERDRNKAFYCKSCGCRVYLCISDQKANHFMSHEHREGCRIAKKKITVRTADFAVNLESILNHKDKSPNLQKQSGSASGKAGNEEEVKKEEDLDIDCIAVLRDSKINSVTGLVNWIKAHRRDEVVEGLNISIDDLVLDEQNFDEVSAAGIHGLRMVRARRFLPKGELEEIKRKYRDYVMLCSFHGSAYEDDKALYFLVKFSETSRNKKFRDHIFGTLDENGVRRTPRDEIIILANWIPVPNDKYKIYRAELNERMVTYEAKADK